MKLKITLLSALFALASIGFGQSNKDALCQKWKVDIEAFIAEMPPEMTAMLDLLPDEQKKMAMAQMTQSVENLFVKFNSDGTINTISQNGPVTGSWKFIENGNAIWSKVDNEESVMDIIELKKDRMRVKERGTQQGQPEIVMTFIPSND